MSALPTITWSFTPEEEALQAKLNEALEQITAHFRPRWEALSRDYRDIHPADAHLRSHSIRSAEEAAKAPFIQALVDIRCRGNPVITLPSEINLQGPDVA